LALAQDQVTSLEALLADVETSLGRCQARLLTSNDVSKHLASFWGRAMQVAGPGSDEWRVLDREMKSHPTWVEVTTTGYARAKECDHFVLLRSLLKRLLDESEPEFLRRQNRPSLQRLFLPGEIYEAKKAVFEAMARATQSLGIVDEYLDQSIFDYLQSLDTGLNLRILTGNVKPIFRALFIPFAAQRGRAEARLCRESHDRFIVLDGIRAVHLGTSINSLGTRAFMINEVTDKVELDRLLKQFADWWAAGQPIA
jgi:hypothetical protein